MFWSQPSKRIYLDYAAATPVAPEVQRAMEPYFSQQFGNPSAIHAEGQAARAVVEAARAQVSALFQVREDDVVFTASGTEANNLAISGIIEAQHATGVPYNSMEVMTTHLEHPSIINTVKYWEQRGVSVVYVDVTADGRVDLTDFKQKLSQNTVLVSVAYVNSEIGTIMPLRQMARIVKAFNQEHEVRVRIHADAAQAPLWLPCAPEQIGADLVSLDTGKCYGPKGVGVLMYRHGISLAPCLFGGGQERGLRPGTENVPLIVGAAAALVRAQRTYKERAATVGVVRDYAITKLIAIPGVHLNGVQDERVANNVNVSIDGVEAEFAVVTLDQAGIACSTKSACGSGKGEGSTVVRTITGNVERATTTLRFSLGEDTTKKDIDTVVGVLTKHIDKTRHFTKQLT